MSISVVARVRVGRPPVLMCTPWHLFLQQGNTVLLLPLLLPQLA
jgi:hypothetical protein